MIGLATYVSSGGLDRGTGLTGDPNQFAAYEALAAPAALVLGRIARRGAWSPVLYGVLALIGLAILASFSRGGVITLALIVVGTLVLPWTIFFRNRRQKGAYIVILAAVAWILLLLGSTAYQERIATRSSRARAVDPGVPISGPRPGPGYKENPLLGMGAGGFEARSLDLLHTTPGVYIRASYVDSNRPVHNAYLEALVDLGPVGFGLFMAVLGLTFWYLVKAALRARAAGAGRPMAHGRRPCPRPGRVCFGDLLPLDRARPHAVDLRRAGAGAGRDLEARAGGRLARANATGTRSVSPASREPRCGRKRKSA